MHVINNELRSHEFQGLEFLKNRGSDCIGVIDDESKLAAALIFSDLHNRGYVALRKTGGGPEYSLTTKGVEAVDAWISRGRT